MSTWLITEHAIGPFELGMPWEDAVAVADELGWDLRYAQPDAGAGCAPFVATPDGDGTGISFEYVDDAAQVNRISVNAGGSPAYEHC